MDKDKKSLPERESFTLAEIQELMVSVRRNQIARIKIRQGGCSIEIEGGQTAPHGARTPPALPELPALPEEAEPEGILVKSPIVGTFYAAPTPDAAPFVQEGDRVKRGDVLFIIESMKLMNEVISDHDGVVAGIHVKNAEGVEYGQPIMTLGSI